MTMSFVKQLENLEKGLYGLKINNERYLGGSLAIINNIAGLMKNQLYIITW